MARITPELAEKYLGDEISYAKAYGDAQVTFSQLQELKDFAAKALEGTVALIIGDVKRKHAALRYGAIASSSMRPVDIQGAEGLAVVLPSGRRALLCWWGSEKDNFFGIIPVVEAVPQDLLDRAEALIASGVTEIPPLRELADEISRYGSLPFPDLRGVYDASPVSIDDAVSFLGEKDPGRVCRSKGIGYISLSGEGRRRRTRVYSSEADVELLEDLLHGFEHRPVEADEGSSEDPDHIVTFHIGPVFEAIRAGEMLALHRSLTAMAVARQFEVNKDRLRTIVDGAARLELSRTANMMTGDVDMIMTVFQIDGADIHVHHNASLNEGNVFVSVMHGQEGDYRSVDVYIASAWYKKEQEAEEVEEYDGRGRRKGTPIDLNGFYALVRNRAERSYRMDEDDLIATIVAGEVPIVGKVLSVDLVNGSIEIHPGMVRTDYTTMIDDMLEYDAETISNNLDGTEIDGYYVTRPDGAVDSMQAKKVPMKKHLKTLQSSGGPKP